jgi:plasmid stabilization system protein ParE
MKRYEVVLAPAAQTQARKVAAWWRDNRPAARDLFDGEMAAVLDRLAEAPNTGRPYRMIRNRQIRRILMARTSYNVYFEVQEERALVRIVAVWHAARGHGPPL